MSKKKILKRIMCPETEDLDHLTGLQQASLLEDIMTKLDELDMEDYFGTEGWRHRMGYRD